MPPILKADRSRPWADIHSACIGGLLGAVGWEGPLGSRFQASTAVAQGLRSSTNSCPPEPQRSPSAPFGSYPPPSYETAVQPAMVTVNFRPAQPRLAGGAACCAPMRPVYKHGKGDSLAKDHPEYLSRPSLSALSLRFNRGLPRVERQNA
jgi:hypothetical protein